MRKTFKINFVEGHPMISDNGNTIVVDTCSPVTFHAEDTLRFMGEDYVPAEYFRDETLRRMWEYTGLDFTTWMGMDVLSKYRIILDYANEEITFLTQDEPGIEGETVTLHDADGVYALQVDGWMYMLVDTMMKLKNSFIMVSEDLRLRCIILTVIFVVGRWKYLMVIFLRHWILRS